MKKESFSKRKKEEKSDFEKQMEGSFEASDIEGQIDVLEETIELDKEMITTMLEEVENIVKEKDKEDIQLLLNNYFDDLGKQIKKASHLLRLLNQEAKEIEEKKTAIIGKEKRARKKENRKDYEEKSEELEKEQDKILEKIKKLEEVRKEASVTYLKKNGQK